MLTLIRGRLPFVRLHVAQSPAGDHWVGWQRGPLTMLLIDPDGEDWRVAAALGTATVVVHSAPQFQPTVEAARHGVPAMVWQNDVPTHLTRYSRWSPTGTGSPAARTSTT
jgi:hypothetical protein